MLQWNDMSSGDDLGKERKSVWAELYHTGLPYTTEDHYKYDRFEIEVDSLLSSWLIFS